MPLQQSLILENFAIQSRIKSCIWESKITIEILNQPIKQSSGTFQITEGTRRAFDLVRKHKTIRTNPTVGAKLPSTPAPSGASAAVDGWRPNIRRLKATVKAVLIGRYEIHVSTLMEVLWNRYSNRSNHVDDMCKLLTRPR